MEVALAIAGVAARCRGHRRHIAKEGTVDRYIAFVERNSEGRFFLYTPDVLGFTAGGVETLDELMSVATDVFRDHVALLEADGDPVPRPRSYDDVMVDPDLAEDRAGAALVVALPLLPRPSPAERISVTIERGLLHEIDRTAKRLGMSRSEMLAEGARRIIAGAA